MENVETASMRTERDGAVGWIVLSRPAVINAINDAIRQGLPQALKDLDQDPAIAVIVIRGEGSRGFCVGADIKETRPAETPIETRRRLEQTAWIEALDSIGKPVIAAIHGFCLGGGLELALACDLRIASRDAIFSLPETGLGLIPGGGGTQRLPRTVGMGTALDLMLTGERIDAQEAFRVGIVSRLADSPEALLALASELAHRIAAKPPVATRFVKEAARKGAEMDLKSGLRLERDLFNLLLATEDKVEAAAAFAEKRAPNYRGK